MTSSDESDYSIKEQESSAYEATDDFSEPLEDAPTFLMTILPVNSSSLCKLGFIHAIFPEQFVVCSYENSPKILPKSPIYNLSGNCIGIIKEPFGPVSSPYYTVYFYPSVTNQAKLENNEILYCLNDSSDFITPNCYYESSSETDVSD